MLPRPPDPAAWRLPLPDFRGSALEGLMDPQRWLGGLSTAPMLGDDLPPLPGSAAYLGDPPLSGGDLGAPPRAQSGLGVPALADASGGWNDNVWRGDQNAAPFRARDLNDLVSRPTQRDTSITMGDATPFGTGQGQGQGQGGGSALEQAIDAASDDPRVRQSMRLAAMLEGGNLDGDWGVGDQGQSFGPYQIYTRVHNVTPDQARDPAYATRYMLPEFQKAVERVPAAMWRDNPMQASALAAFYAERPYEMYPAARVQDRWNVLQARSQRTNMSTTPATPSASGAVQAATSVLGVPYVWGGTTTKGFDCSGLTQWSYAKAGKTIPRTAQQQYNSAAKIAPRDMQAGDLVFYQGTYASNEPITHVGIYAGNGQVIMATSEGSPVKYVPLNDPYWSKHYAGAGRY